MLLTKHEKVGGKLYDEVSDSYKLALSRAKKLKEGSKKYDTKSHPGRICFVTVLEEIELKNKILELVKKVENEQEKN